MKEGFADDYEESLVTMLFIYERLGNTAMVNEVQRLYDQLDQPDGYIIDD